MIKDLIEKDIKINELQNKIDKAIEYIKLATDGITEYLDIKEIKELLDILGEKE